MLDLHARNGDRMHSLSHSGISREPSFLLGRDILDPYEHGRLIEPEVIADLAEHGIRCAEDHQSFRTGFDKSSSHDGRSCRIGKDSLTDGFHLGRRFFRGCSGDDPASVYEKSVIDDVMDIVIARNFDRPGALSGSGRTDKCDDSDPREILTGCLVAVKYTFDVFARLGNRTGISSCGSTLKTLKRSTEFRQQSLARC